MLPPGMVPGKELAMEECNPGPAAGPGAAVAAVGVVKMACDAARTVRERFRTLHPASVESMGATWIEGAARRNG